MKCKIFTGVWYDAQDQFNKWAEGKTLTKDVLIHTIPVLNSHPQHETRISIIVYHPEGAIWDSTKSKPIQRIQPQTTESTRLEPNVEPYLTMPIHKKPEPHVKLEEAQVTQ